MTEKEKIEEQEKKDILSDILSDIAYEESSCPHCTLKMYLHDGSGFCPGGTEEFGGRR